MRITHVPSGASHEDIGYCRLQYIYAPLPSLDARLPTLSLEQLESAYRKAKQQAFVDGMRRAARMFGEQAAMSIMRELLLCK